MTDQASARRTAPARTTGRTALVVGRVLFALLGFSALVTEVATLVERDDWDPGNFVSFFTVEANTLTVISLLLSSFALATGRSSRWLDFVRGLTTFAMTTVILIFIVLLSGYPASELTAVPWDNTVLHYIMPIVVILDWLIAPPSPAFTIRTALTWLALPLAYFVYSLIRGPFAGWYPYPFINPAVRGYAGVAITAVIIAVVLALIACLVALAGRWRAGRFAPSATTTT